MERHEYRLGGGGRAQQGGPRLLDSPASSSKYSKISEYFPSSSFSEALNSNLTSTQMTTLRQQGCAGKLMLCCKVLICLWKNEE